MKDAERYAAAMAALAAIASKESNRDALTAGAQYRGRLHVRADLEGKQFTAAFDAALTVNHDAERVTSQAADQAHLLGLVLEQIPAKRRASLLAELPAAFDRAGKLPDCDAKLVGAADALLKQLRSRVQKTVRGSVSTSYSILQ